MCAAFVVVNSKHVHWNNSISGMIGIIRIQTCLLKEIRITRKHLLYNNCHFSVCNYMYMCATTCTCVQVHVHDCCSNYSIRQCMYMYYFVIHVHVNCTLRHIC